MARPIEATPMLEGKDADNFLRAVQDAQPSAERLEWLDKLARESKSVEKEEE